MLRAMRSVAGLITVLVISLAAPPARAQSPERVERSVTVQHRSAAGAPVWGPRYAAVTADFYIRLGTGYYQLKKAYEALVSLQRAHPRRLRVVVRIMDRPSSAAAIAEAALEAHRQGRFFEFLDALLKTHNRPPSAVQMTQLCQRARVDCERVNRAIDGKHHTAALEANLRHFHRMGARHNQGTVLFNGVETPLSVLNRQGQDSQTLEGRYDQAYSQAVDLMRHGATLATVYQHAIRRRYTDRPPSPVPWGAIDGGKRPRRNTSFRPSRLASQSASGMDRHTRRKDNPRVVINLFCSFQSSNCGRTWDAIRRAIAVYPDEIQLQFNHLFDDGDANQPAAQGAHEAALCAEDQGAFWEFYDHHMGTVYTRPPNHLDVDMMRRTAQSLGLDEERFLACWTKGTHTATVRGLVQRARAAGVLRTPTVVINGRLYEGRFDGKVLLRLIADELRPGLLEHYFPGPVTAPERAR